MTLMDGFKMVGFLVSVYISFRIAMIIFDGIRGIDNTKDNVLLPD